MGSRSQATYAASRHRGASAKSAASAEIVSFLRSPAVLQKRNCIPMTLSGKFDESRACRRGKWSKGRHARRRGRCFTPPASTTEALAKPLVAIVHSLSTVTPCNMHLRDLAAACRARASRQRAAPPIEFNTIVVTDGIAMGTRGHARLADEPRGDRRFRRAGGARPFARRSPVPGRLRQDHPGRGDGGGAARSAHGHPLRRLDHAGPCSATRRSPSRTCSKRSARTAPARSTTRSCSAVEQAACPGAGACGGQFTANTMALAMTFLGLSPMGLNDIPAVHPDKRQAAFEAGRLVVDALARRPQRAQPDHCRRACATPPSPAPRRPARPTSSCICWRSRARRASRKRIQHRPVRRGLARDAGDRRPEARRPLHGAGHDARPAARLCSAGG